MIYWRRRYPKYILPSPEMQKKKPSIAYFSMEIALDRGIPNYAGGLGVLAADTLYSCADLGTPVVAVSLVYHLDDDPAKAFDPSPFMRRRPETFLLPLEDREIRIGIWEMTLRGRTGHPLPILFLTSNLPENQPWDRDLTKNLYAADRYTRLGQEVILGIGGIRALALLGYTAIRRYHMNEGHSALLTVALLKDHGLDQEQVRTLCSFTTHTPVSAGHDNFTPELAGDILRDANPLLLPDLPFRDELSTTRLALHFSARRNSVSEKHREICAAMFPEYPFDNVTNGIYHPRWTGEHMRALFDAHLPGWEKDPALFAEAPERLPTGALTKARAREKSALIDWVNASHSFFPFQSVGSQDLLEKDVLTLGFARRVVPYKRTALVFRHLDALRALGHQKIQFVFACRCHPSDAFCQNVRREVAYAANLLRRDIRIALIPDYDVDIARRMTSGCDVWLNNPYPPKEASGTSGMKAALNGGLNLSIADGWWLEGYRRDPQSGWLFGETPPAGVDNRDEYDAQELLRALKEVIRCYSHDPQGWALRMKHAIALLAYFNTHRVVEEYARKIWAGSI